MKPYKLHTMQPWFFEQLEVFGSLELPFSVLMQIPTSEELVLAEVDKFDGEDEKMLKGHPVLF